jgi:NitT/TauT family transport system substrate-binding protein
MKRLTAQAQFTRRDVLAGAATFGASTVFGVPTIVIAADPKEKVQMSVGGEHALVYFPFDLAQRLGYFEREGLDVELIYMKGGSEAAEALVSGSVDYSGNAIDHAIAAAQRGKSLVMISDFMNEPGVTLLVRPQDKGKYTSFKDMKGKTIGVTSPGSATHVLGVWMAKQAGISRDDIKFVGVGAGATMPAALAGGQVDAAMGNDPFATQMIREGRAAAWIELFHAVDVRKAIGFSSYCFTGALTRGDVIAKNPQRTQKVVNALVRAQKYMQIHSADEISGALTDEFRGGLTKDAWAPGYVHSAPAYTKNGEIPPEGVRAVIETNAFFLSNDAKIDATKIYDNRFVDRAKATVKI